MTRLDPMPVFVFRLTLTLADFNQGTALFKSIGGLKYETEVVDVRVGGRNDTTIKLPGSTKWNNIVLKRGFTQDFKLIKWREDWMTGRQRVRCDGTIYQLNHSLGEVCAWSFKRGWPCKWEISEYDASKNEIAIETLEIAHEGLTFDPNPAEKAAK